MHSAGINTMTNESIAASWSDVEALTMSIHRAARTQNWLEVLDLAASRHQRLQTHFDLYPVGPENADVYRQCLDKMLGKEMELQTLVREARKSLMSEGAAIYHQKRALGAYRNSSLG